jgi:glycosyltransferase involved in cell wall biosynthesis
MKLLLLDNRVEYFVSHRWPLAEAARSAGHEVHVSALTPGDASAVIAGGFPFHALSTRRRRNRVLQEASVFMSLRRLLKAMRPELCHLFTLRAVFLGLAALAVLRRRPSRVVCSVTGLGYLFTDHGFKSRVARSMIGLAIALLSRMVKPVFIFQNADDRSLFARRKWVPLARSFLISGSGVDIARFAETEPPPGQPIILFCARYLHHKGINEFVEAARALKKAGSKVRFVLAGGVDPDNPASVDRAQVDQWVADGVVEDWGFRGDMPEVLAAATIVVLPSYREGFPKVVLEAAATGRAIITTDVPGCREAVRGGVTGELVPVRDPAALANAIAALVAEPGRIAALGKAAREDVVRRFSSSEIANAVLQTYQAPNLCRQD